MHLYASIGTLRYSDRSFNLVVDIDHGIMDYYRSMIPKTIKTNKPLYPAHISVIRKETPPNVDCWLKHHGEEIAFQYDPAIQIGQVYCWLNVYCNRLEEIRLELGLPIHNEITEPPEGFKCCFHTTIGNRKCL